MIDAKAGMCRHGESSYETLPCDRRAVWGTRGYCQQHARDGWTRSVLSAVGYAVYGKPHFTMRADGTITKRKPFEAP